MIQTLIFPTIAVILGALFYIIVGERSCRSLCACTATMCSAVGIALSLVTMLNFLPVSEETAVTVFVLSGMSAVLTSPLLGDIKEMLPVTRGICVSLLISLVECFLSVMMMVKKLDGSMLAIFLLFTMATVLQTLIVRHIYLASVASRMFRGRI